jgi:DNA repair protein RadB
MNRLKTKCKPIDELLGGGLEKAAITKVFGEPGSGKTNFCLQVSKEVALLGKKVAYIDTEGVSIERLKQICDSSSKIKKILDKILFYNPFSLESQEEIVADVINKKNIGLIVIDTMNLFYRVAHEEDKEIPKRSYLRQMANLQVGARKNDIFVLITEQVYTDKNQEIKPFTHRDTDHMVKTILRFDKIDIGVRQAVIIKHRSEPENKSNLFKITQNGLE